MTLERVRRCLEPGMSVIVGSVDAEGNPSCCRALALRSHDDLATATVFLPAATCRETLANVEAVRRVAVVTTHPISHCATQFKGIVERTRDARAEEEAFVRERFESFGEVLNAIGWPPRATRAVNQWPAIALEMRVDEIFEQSPGPKAGTRLR